MNSGVRSKRVKVRARSAATRNKCRKPDPSESCAKAREFDGVARGGSAKSPSQKLFRNLGGFASENDLCYTHRQMFLEMLGPSRGVHLLILVLVCGRDLILLLSPPNANVELM